MTLLIHNNLFIENYIALIIWVICGKVSQFPAVSKTEDGKALKNLPFIPYRQQKKSIFHFLTCIHCFPLTIKKAKNNPNESKIAQ